jgi:hypothetical protein
MPPQAILAATCHVTPLATAPDPRNTVLGLGQSRFSNSGPDLLGQTRQHRRRQLQPGCGRAASTNIAAVIGNGAPQTREMQKGWSRARI